MARAHTHPCRDCQTPVECHGDLERNFDGWPEVVCRDFHIHGAEPLCDSCNKPECHDCGDPSDVTFVDYDDASGYRGDEGLCLPCLEKRESRA
jgi:hypothetical protein